jgi:hypothetical protein
MNFFRFGTMVLSGVLGLAAVWIISVELIRPILPSPYVPSADIFEVHRHSARTAAWIGFIRGSLWTDYAMTLAPDLTGSNATPLEALMSTRAVAVRAARLAPCDARAWLLIAGIDSRGLDTKSDAAPLKMSYYCGLNETSLIPLRLTIATRSDAIADSDLQILVGGELRTIMTRKKDLKPFIVAAYRKALPEGRRLIEAQVGDTDRSLLNLLTKINQIR